MYGLCTGVMYDLLLLLLFIIGIKSYDIMYGLCTGVMYDLLLLLLFVIGIKSYDIWCTGGILSNHMIFGVILSFLAYLFLLSNHVIFLVLRVCYQIIFYLV